MKIYLVAGSGLISFGLAVIGLFGSYTLCNDVESCVNLLHFFFIHTIPVLPLFIFALITYFMREEVYKAWFRFARWWIPLSIALIFLSPEYSSDWILPIEKGSVALTTSILFVCISLIVIALKYWRLNRRS